MKSFCILLNGSIKNDSRVIKTIHSLSKKYKVDLFYINPSEQDSSNFNKNVSLFPISNPNGRIKQKILVNALFYKEFLYLSDAVIHKGKRYDYVWANDLPTLLPAIKVKEHFKGTQLVYDSHEIYTASISQLFKLDTGFLKSQIFKVLEKKMVKLAFEKEKEFIKNVDVFITVGDALRDYFVEELNYPKAVVIKNCPLLQKQIKGKDLLRKKFKLKAEDKIFLYQGGIQYGRGLEVVVDAFIETPNNIKLIIIGGGVLKPKLELIARRAQNKIFFIDTVPYKDLFDYTISADYGLNYVDNLNLNTQLACPNKLFEYIQNELPILMSKNIENTRLNNKYKIGVCGTIDKKSILHTIEQIVTLDLNEFKDNLRIAKNDLNWEEQEKILLQLFQE